MSITHSEPSSSPPIGGPDWDAAHVVTTITLPDQGSDPSSPAASFHILYTKATGLFVKDSAGTVVGPLGSGGGLAGPSAIYAYTNFR